MIAIRALDLSEGKEVNIYTDSAYVVGVVHVEIALPNVEEQDIDQLQDHQSNIG